MGDSNNDEMGKAVVLWQGYGNVHTYIFAGGASAYNDFRGRVFLYRRETVDCCLGMRGNVNGDPGDAVNVSNLTYLFKGGPPPLPCP